MKFMPKIGSNGHRMKQEIQVLFLSFQRTNKMLCFIFFFSHLQPSFSQKVRDNGSKPFAIVNAVAPDSPAKEAVLLYILHRFYTLYLVLDLITTINK